MSTEAHSVDALELKRRVVTPMFLGGAFPDEPTELRQPSIKGVLRFWFRATAPRNAQGAATTNDASSSEQQLFGSADAGQSTVRLRVSNMTLTHGLGHPGTGYVTAAGAGAGAAR